MPTPKPSPEHALKTFKKRLYALRKTRTKLSQEDLGMRLGLHQTSIGDWENEKLTASPSVPYLVALCDIFKVSPAYLLGMTDSENGLEPDAWVVNEDAEKSLRENRDAATGHVLFKVPRRSRVVTEDEAKRLRKELRLGKLE
jgi:transcriptional regulator with XRE-family HTH domain